MEDKQYHASQQDYLVIIAVLGFFALTALYDTITSSEFDGWIILAILAIIFIPMLAHKVSYKDGTWIFKEPFSKTLVVSDEDLKRLEISPGDMTHLNLIFSHNGKIENHKFSFLWDMIPLFKDVEETIPGRLGENAQKLPEWREKLAASKAVTAGVMALIAAIALNVATIIIVVTREQLDILLNACGAFAGVFAVILFVTLAFRIIRIRYVKQGELWGTIILLLGFIFCFPILISKASLDLIPVLTAVFGITAAFVAIGLRSIFAPGLVGSIIALILSVGMVWIGLM
ncbi:MAG: hypothetical protein P9X24_19905 [Candidatus Hatepunaea meridiana]|nr:hypothetical protein [Candidatus Hatepunaea meridiana]